MKRAQRVGLVWVALAVSVSYAETVSLSSVGLGSGRTSPGRPADRRDDGGRGLLEQCGLMTARALPGGAVAKPPSSSKQETPPLRPGNTATSPELKLRKPQAQVDSVVAAAERLGTEAPERLAKWLVQHMQWDLDSAAEDLPIFPFFRFEHKMAVPIPWPRPNERITFSTTVKPATPQAWSSASVQLVKGVNLVAAMASDAAQPLTEPYMSIGAEYSLGLSTPDNFINRVLDFIQKPLGEPVISRVGNDFIATIGKTNYGGKGPEAHAGIASSMQVGALRLRSTFTRDIHGRNRWRLSL